MSTAFITQFVLFLAMFADEGEAMGFARVDPAGERLAFVSGGDSRIWPLKAGLLLTGWGSTRLIDPRNPNQVVKLERVARSRVLELAGTDDILVLYGWKFTRMDPKTGEERWTL